MIRGHGGRRGDTGKRYSPNWRWPPSAAEDSGSCWPNWGGNSININVNNNNIWVKILQYHNRYAQNGNWNHNVEHRRGVAYRDTATGNKYRPTNNAGVQTRENYRGRDNAARPSTIDRTPGAAGNVTRPSQGGNNNLTRPSPETGNNVTRPSQGTGNNVTRPSPGGSNNLTRPSPAAGGNQARPSPQMPATRPSAPPASRPAPSYTSESRPRQLEADRGAQSRAAAQSSQRAAPQRAAPSGSGNRGGGGGGQGRGR